MTKRDPDDIPPAEVARRRDAGLLKMLKTPPKRHKDETPKGSKEEPKP